MWNRPRWRYFIEAGEKSGLICDACFVVSQIIFYYNFYVFDNQLHSDRTTKTTTGAKRHSVIMTVLASLQIWFEKFTLDNLLLEVECWLVQGQSIFELELVQLQKANAPPT